ncbi:flagellar hook-basal body complex protein FliE [Mangrovicella endophytica]|uniref:flagellar hook-basal body complex protein FliE n=1 Tax=Mangrovicella endophytica TaxID=2066697 RepID=UPI000C9E4440|nr:flagellar hook-basal body complex protein FliE [Mangrovicella endophytica]
MIPAIGSALPRLDVTNADTGMSVGGSRSVGAASTVGGASDFSKVLAEVANDAIGTMKNAEAVSIQGVKGQTSTQAVVDAVMAAERTLQTAVVLRDKAVSAYLDLSRMAI